MAKKSMIARERRRMLLAKSRKKTRSKLRDIMKAVDASYDEKIDASYRLQQRERDESPSRVRTRCRACGRPRGVYRKFGLCRMHLREAVMRGDVPGLRKASW